MIHKRLIYHGVISLLALLIATLCTSAASPPANWPSFRGPQADGVAQGQNLPDRWDGVRGENIQWKTVIPGLAHSSPIVWGDRVYVTTAVSSFSAVVFSRRAAGPQASEQPPL